MAASEQIEPDADAKMREALFRSKDILNAALVKWKETLPMDDGTPESIGTRACLSAMIGRLNYDVRQPGTPPQALLKRFGASAPFNKAWSALNAAMQAYAAPHLEFCKEHGLDNE